MNSAQPLGNGYIVYDFFVGRLDLKPAEQLILGIILSFTRDGGDFTGSHAYLAGRVNVSPRTVAGILNSLTDKGYIVKVRSRGSAYPHYRANLSALCSSLTDPDLAKSAGCSDVANCKMTLQNMQDGCAEIAHSNKEINKEIIKNNNPNNKNRARTRKDSPSGIVVNKRENGQEPEPERRDPEDDIIYIGSNKIVHMTVRQYNALYKLVGMDVLDDYIARAEMYATEGTKRIGHVYSFYNTLRRWLREDFGV